MCELVKEPKKFNGSMVEFRAEIVAGRHGSLLHDRSCNAYVPWAASDSPVTDAPEEDEYAYVFHWATQKFFPEPLEWKRVRAAMPVVLQKDCSHAAVIRELNQILDAQSLDEQCDWCSHSAIQADVRGRFDAHERNLIAIRDSMGGAIRTSPVGFGPMRLSLNRVVVDRFSDVVVIPMESLGAPGTVVNLPSGEVTLPAGFTHREERGIDSAVGRFVSPDGQLVINYDIGPLAGVYADREGP